VFLFSLQFWYTKQEKPVGRGVKIHEESCFALIKILGRKKKISLMELMAKKKAILELGWPILES
jgi:hypothetical protein